MSSYDIRVIFYMKNVKSIRQFYLLYLLLYFRINFSFTRTDTIIMNKFNIFGDTRSNINSLFKMNRSQYGRNVTILQKHRISMDFTLFEK